METQRRGDAAALSPLLVGVSLSTRGLETERCIAAGFITIKCGRPETVSKTNVTLGNNTGTKASSSLVFSKDE